MRSLSLGTLLVCAATAHAYANHPTQQTPHHKHNHLQHKTRRPLVHPIRASANTEPAAATPGSGRTIDLRRGGGGAQRPDAKSYGRDPRPFAADAPDVGTDEAATPPPRTARHVTLIETLPDLDEALAAAGGRPVVIKFYAKWCASCKAIKPRFDRIAAQTRSKADFYEVEYSRSKPLCIAADVRYMPCAHIYLGDELVYAASLATQVFSKFSKRVEDLATGEAADSGS